MTSANNHRAVPGAVLAGATIGATALPALAAPAAPELSAVDPRVLDLWRRRTKVRAIVNRLSVQYHAANAQLPSSASLSASVVMPPSKRSAISSG